MTWSDVDSPGQVTASTNRSWATVDLLSNALTVTPTAGFRRYSSSVRPNGCTDREVDLEVMALPI